MINIKKWLNLAYYISEADQFRIHFNKNRSKLTHSQQKEVDKYAIVKRKRDSKLKENSNSTTIWDKF